MQNGLKHTSSSTCSGCKQMCENSHRPALENTSYFHSQKLINHFPPFGKQGPFLSFHAFQPYLRRFISLTIQITSLNLFPSFTSNQLPPSELYLLCVAPFFILSICTSSLFSQTFCFKNDLRGKLQPKSCLH